MHPLIELADQVAAATGPDRRLDALIAVAFGFATGIHPTKPERCAWHDGMGLFTASPEYTASLDAAMMLVPEGAGFNLDRYWLREGVAWKVEITTGGIPEQPRQVFDCWDAYTASLAITAAALKARAHSTKESDNG